MPEAVMSQMATSDVVDIWYRAIDPAAAARSWALVTAEERHRAACFHRASHAASFLGSRALTRLALSSVLGVGPLEVSVTTDCEHCGDALHGRPRASAGGRSCEFSLTRAGETVAVAIASGPVGFDAEPQRRGVTDLITSQVFSDDDRAALAAGSPATISSRTLALWVAKEAVGKLSGLGLEHAESIRVALPLDAWSTATDAPGRPCALVAVELPGTAVAALAARTRPSQIRIRHASSLGL